jgi:hypothetical protein
MKRKGSITSSTTAAADNTATGITGSSSVTASADAIAPVAVPTTAVTGGGTDTTATGGTNSTENLSAKERRAKVCHSHTALSIVTD